MKLVKLLSAVVALMTVLGLNAAAQDNKIVVHAFETKTGCPISGAVRPLREAMAPRLPGVSWEVHDTPMASWEIVRPSVKKAVPFIRQYQVRKVPWYIVLYQGRIVFEGMQFTVPEGPDGQKLEVYSYVSRMKDEGREIANLLEQVLQDLLKGKAPKEPILVNVRGCGVPKEIWQDPPERPK